MRIVSDVPLTDERIQTEDKDVRLAAWGDHQAFRRIVDRHDADLRRLAFRLVGSRVDDVMQESYLKAFVGLLQFDAQRGSFVGWLHRIVYRASLDELRRQRSKSFLDVPHIEAEIPEADTGPEATVIRRTMLANALGALSVENRAAIILVDASGFSYAEAAQILDIPEGTLASRLYQARSLLRGVLKKRGEVEGGSL
jgi:RNA polymerase sigma-70 factor (ECF subfamily)